jgi:chemotaxis response regulator CheB
MKTRVLIIEDSYCKMFATKQLLESKLNLKIKVMQADSGEQLLKSTMSINPDFIMLRPEGSVMSLLQTMEKRSVNRRNSDVTIMYTQECADLQSRRVREFAQHFMKAMPKAA